MSALTDEQLAELGEAFDLFDRDGDGAIGLEELSNVLALLGQDAQHDDLQALIASADRDNNGVIDRQEFTTLMAKHLFTAETKPTDAQEMAAAFRVFDSDGDGLIGREELKAALVGMGERVGEEEIEAMIGAADKNGDGRIDFDEFCQLLNHQVQVFRMVVPPFWQEKYKREAGKNWDKFYKRNHNHFFKDRHWLQREFPDLASLTHTSTLMEVGCGVGNLVFPVFAATGCRVVAADFAATAISILTQDSRFDTHKMTALVHDFTAGPVDLKADIATMIFVLSAVPPEKHVAFLRHVSQSSPVILFRDYAVEDAAQKRFAEDNKLSEVLFVRQDGTLAYYFDVEYVRGIAEQAGYKLTTAEYVASETVNVKENLCVARRFLQCRMQLKCVVCDK